MRAEGGPGAECARSAEASLAGLGLRGVAIRLGHLQIPLALAGVLTLAGVVGALAGRASLAGVHAFAFHLAFGGAGGGHRRRREHDRSGRGECNTGQDSGIHSPYSSLSGRAPPIVAPGGETTVCRTRTTAALR